MVGSQLKRRAKQFIFMLAVWQSAFGFLDNLENSDVRALRTRLEEEKATRLLLQNDVDVMMVKVARLEKALQGLTVPETRPDTSVTRHEASFSARLPLTTTLDSLHTVVFTSVLHNIGSCYSANTGIFKAPFNGTYVFSLTLLALAPKYVHAQMMKNGDQIGRLFTGDNKASWAHTGSVTIVTSLTENDEVFIREFQGHTGVLHGDYFCTFSGFLLDAV